MIFRLLFFVAFAIPSIPARAEHAAAPAGHWNLDGDARDSVAGGHHGKLSGRAQFFDSPIGGTGKLLWCDGVGTFVQIERMTDLAAGNFSVSLWVCPLDVTPSGIVGQS